MEKEAILMKNDTWAYVNGFLVRPAEPLRAIEWDPGDAKVKADLV